MLWEVAFGKELKDKKELVVYGAGAIANDVVNCIKGAPYFTNVTCFMVSDKTGNPRELLGFPVIDIQEGKEKYQEAIILIAVMDKYLEEITINLKKEGFRNVVSLTFESELLSELRAGCFIEMRRLEGKETYFLAEALKEVEIAEASNDKISVYMAKCHMDKELHMDTSKYGWEVPIQVGTELTEKRIAEICDNQGENISSKNREYCELTALYWIWKNDCSDYAGLCHYRRHFDIERNAINKLPLSDIDVVLTVPVFNFPNIRASYVRDHIESDWDTMLEAIEKLQPEYRATAEKVQNGIFYYAYNMFIARKEILNDYCEWLFPILLYCEEKCGKKEDMYQRRYIGFLAERLLTIYFVHNEDKYKIAHAQKVFCS